MEKTVHINNEEAESGRSNIGNYETAPRKKGMKGILYTLYPPNPNGGGRFKNHWRKFWWCELIFLSISALLIVIIGIYAVVPAVAQHDTNHSTLEVTEQLVTKSTPDSIHLKIGALAKSGSKFHPILQGFNAGLHLKDDEPFVYIDIPDAKVTRVTAIVVEHDVTFANKDAFIRYTKTVMGSEEFDVYLDGKPTLVLGKLPHMKVDYKKKITMKGLNKLKGLNIYDLTILSGKDEIVDGVYNMIGTVYIPNPSVQTLELGNITMNLHVDGINVGYSLMPNLTLKPGNNTIPMQSYVDQLKLIGMITKTYKDGVIPLEITGNSSISAEGKHLEYFEEAIKDNLIKVNLDCAPALKKIGIFQ